LVRTESEKDDAPSETWWSWRAACETRRLTVSSRFELCLMRLQANESRRPKPSPENADPGSEGEQELTEILGAARRNASSKVKRSRPGKTS